MPRHPIAIGPGVANYRSMIGQHRTFFSHLQLTADSDDGTQIANYVAANPGYDAVRLTSHGSPGRVTVSTSMLSLASPTDYSARLNQIRLQKIETLDPSRLSKIRNGPVVSGLNPNFAQTRGFTNPRSIKPYANYQRYR